MYNFLIDRHFWAAIFAAIVVWALAYFFADGFIVKQNLVKQNFNPFYVIILLPILEELAFRGFIQDIMLSALKHKKIQENLIAKLSYANVLTSILFAFSHLLHQSPFWAFLVFFPSLIFGYFKDRTNSTIPSIVLHIFYNAGFFILFVW